MPLDAGLQTDTIYPIQVAAVRVRNATEFVPHALTALAEQADAEGIKVVRAVIDGWESGEERYDRSGEQLLVAVTDDGVVGVGGLTFSLP